MLAQPQVTRFAAGALAAAALSGCIAMIEDHQRVEGFPPLEVIEHHVSHTEMRENCVPYTGPFTTPAGCTLFVFDRMEAHIVVSKDFPRPHVLAHERLHAAGYDHVGSQAMKRIWEAWKAKNGNSYNGYQLVQWLDD